MNQIERNALIENYGRAYELFTKALKKYPEGMWTFKPAPEKWSIRQIIIHLADSEANSYFRCRRFIAEPGSKVLGYNQDRWADTLFCNEQNTADALELFRLLRKMSFDLIKNLPEEYWSRTVMHEVSGEMTMQRWLEIYEEHIPKHIGQMERVFEAWKQLNGN